MESLLQHKSQTFLGITEDGLASAVTTGGNPDCQLILRGGSTGPNYHAENVAMAKAALETVKAPASVMIDCSHANSGKDPARQPEVLKEVLQQVENGSDCIHAFMLESHLDAGSQPFPRPSINSNMEFLLPTAASIGRPPKLAFDRLPM